jgi:hypothetical protein
MHRLMFDEDSFVIVLHGAFNAFGLIGPEHNGISIVCENNSREVIMTHHRAPSGGGKVTDDQRREYERICGMNQDEFKEFVNSHPKVQYKIMLPKLRPIVKPKLGFQSADFAATKFATATDKRLFIEDLIQFFCNHCERDQFTRRIYDGLYLHLGHIAHYNLHQFYNTWFEEPVMRVQFLEHHEKYPVPGDWRDVADAFQAWIMGKEGQAVLKHYRKEAGHES